MVAGVAGAVVAAALVGVGPRQAGGRQHQYQKYGIHFLQYFVKRGANKRNMLLWYVKHVSELVLCQSLHIFHQCRLVLAKKIIFVSKVQRPLSP